MEDKELYEKVLKELCDMKKELEGESFILYERHELVKRCITLLEYTIGDFILNTFEKEKGE